MVKRVHEEILRLDIAMDDIMPVAKLNGLEKLVDIFLNSSWLEPVRPLLQDFEQILLQELENEVKSVLPFECLSK